MPGITKDTLENMVRWADALDSYEHRTVANVCKYVRTLTMTPHGYQSLRFTDQAGLRGIAEQSSAIDHGNPTWTDPGSSYMLIGRQDAPVQLSIEQVGELVEYLQRWLENGKLGP